MCYRVAFHGPAQSIICQLLASFFFSTLSDSVISKVPAKCVNSRRNHRNHRRTISLNDQPLRFLADSLDTSQNQNGWRFLRSADRCFGREVILVMDFLSCKDTAQSDMLLGSTQFYQIFFDWSQLSSAPTGHSEVMWAWWQTPATSHLEAIGKYGSSGSDFCFLPLLVITGCCYSQNSKMKKEMAIKMQQMPKVNPQLNILDWQLIIYRKKTNMKSMSRIKHGDGVR